MAQLPQTLSGQNASNFAFGTMQFGGGTPEADCEEIYQMARDAGINVFDTAHGYTEGKSETILGKLIDTHRDEIILATKCAHPAPSTAQNIQSQFDESRRRLGQDMVDILFLHRWDAETPLEETMGALAGMHQKGQFRTLGVSNFSAWQTMKAVRIADTFGLSIDVIQPMYSLVKRQVEVEILPMCVSEGIAVTSYSPLGGGVLTGKYARGDSGRILENPEYKSRYRQPWVFETATRLGEMAREHGVDPVTLAVGWVARNPAITAPLISGRTRSQFEPSLKAVCFEMPDALYAEISTLSPTPPPATDRLEEQS